MLIRQLQYIGDLRSAMQTQQEFEAVKPALTTVVEHETIPLDVEMNQEVYVQTVQDQQTQKQDTSQTNFTSLQAQTTVLRLKRQSRIMSNVNQGATVFLLFASIVAKELNLNGIISRLTICETLLVSVSVFCLVAWALHRQARQSILQINDIHQIGLLAEALDAETMTRPKAIIMALRRLLPRLQATDTTVLTSHQRLCLYKALTWRSLNWKGVGGSLLRYDRGLALDILKAMEQIGDKDALPYVQYVAKSSWDKELRDAANNCLSFLHQKAEEHRRSETYLRPSSAISTTPDILLRPASGVTDMPSDELLRAGDKGTNLPTI